MCGCCAPQMLVPICCVNFLQDFDANSMKNKVRAYSKTPVDTKTLIKTAKDQNIEDLPDQMNLDGAPIVNVDLKRLRIVGLPTDIIDN